MGIFPKGGENKTYLKPPPGFNIFLVLLRCLKTEQALKILPCPQAPVESCKTPRVSLQDLAVI